MAEFVPTKKRILQELDRELAMRKRVYPRLVEQGKLSDRQCSERIAIVKAARRIIEQAMSDDDGLFTDPAKDH